jgi:hypothetical protein
VFASFTMLSARDAIVTRDGKVSGQGYAVRNVPPLGRLALAERPNGGERCDCYEISRRFVITVPSTPAIVA